VKHLTFFNAGLTVVILGSLLFRRRHANIVWWTVSTSLMISFSFLLSRAGGMVYQDPRPLTTVHLRPLAVLIPFLPHVDHNSFPSSHAVLAAALASSVLFLSQRWAIPVVIVGILDTWARMGLGSHQVINVIGGSLVVALATMLAFLMGTIFAAVLLPSIPPSWTAERFRLRYLDQRVGSA
jgi:membrane-associated phospholipid phosphatase